MWLDVLYYVAHTLAAILLCFLLIVSPSNFSTVQIVLCTHKLIRQLLYAFFFSLYLAVLLFRGHFKCFLLNFNSFSFFYCFVFVFAHLKLNVKNKILCALCIDRSIINTVMFYKIDLHTRCAVPLNLKSIKFCTKISFEWWKNVICISFRCCALHTHRSLSHLTFCQCVCCDDASFFCCCLLRARIHFDATINL